MAGDLGERPIAPQRQVEHLLLVLGQERSIALEEGNVAASRREGVKAHAFTVYSVLESGSMGPILLEAFRYNKWANLHLLDVCASFKDEQLEMTAPGTYGTIASTFFHLLAAEQRYIKRLGGSEPRISERNAFPGLAALRAEAVRSGDELIEIVPRIKSDDAHEATFQDGRFMLHSGVVVIQALHHGNDHRTHICTILGHNGLTYGDMDVWAYGDATGAMVPIAAS